MYITLKSKCTATLKETRRVCKEKRKREMHKMIETGRHANKEKDTL